MSDDYETARHYGFSREDYMAEQKEIMDRMEFLGCPNCRYSDRNSPTCDNIIRDECNIYRCGCPFYSKKEV